MSVFPRSEYARRIERVKQRMAAAGIDVLLCTDPANMNYLSGYDGWSFYVHQLVALALDEDEPAWIGRQMDAAGAALTTFVRPDNIRGYPDDYVDSPERHPMAFVAQELRVRGWDKRRIGVEMDAFSFTAQAHAQLRADLPRAELVDARALVNWVRIVKSPAELEMMRIAATIVAGAMGVGIETILPGVRECDVVARICAAQIAGTPQHWGDYPAALPSAPSGIKTAAPHLTWSGDRYAADTVTFLELAGCHHRYHAALARTVCLGRPPDGLAELAAVVADGLEVALDAARAGRTCHEVEAVWRALITKKGHEKGSRIGYSIGLGYPPDWGERTASLRPRDMTVLEPDMCFHMILGMWRESWGYELSETFCVSAAGPPEILTAFPRRLFVKA
jgi:Xaa-Pro aminopeptidase